MKKKKKPPAPTERWLLGPWDELELDPTTWAVGTDTLCGYTAKVGRQRAGLHAACKADPQRAELGWRPKLWPRPQQQGVPLCADPHLPALGA
jgi:hypothetical protein